MKHKHLVNIAFLIFSIALTFPLVALAERSSFSADADFVSTDASGCLSTEVSVFVKKPDLGKRGCAAKAAITITQIDHCSERAQLSLSGIAKVQHGGLQIDEHISSATLKTTVKLFDVRSKRPVNLNVDITWVGLDDVVHSFTTNDIETSGRFVKVKTPIHIVTRSASAFGSIMYRDTNLIPNRSADSVIRVLSSDEPVYRLENIAP